jgi:S-formylglutathione hydrolase FrmB
MRLRGLMLLLVGGIALANVASASAVTVRQWDTPGGKYINRVDETALDLVNGKLVTNVVLPTGYSSRKCWPVLYLLHGTADGPAPVSLQWLQINNGELLKMKIPAILVIPGSGDSWWINDWWHGYRHPAWESWLLQDIVPMVGRRLHVCPGRSEHSIAGLSMGGYGAIYLASQRPDYFGSAGSFSGVLSPESPTFLQIFPTFTTTWGPADHFYAIGHDPLALVDNLQHTRVFVGVGNGVPTAGEGDDVTAEFEEAEFHQEDTSFVAKARAAHVSVKYDQHAGIHTALNWLESLTHMLQWKPFKPIVQNPSSWKFFTVETSGTAWDYGFAFSRYAPPKQLIEFSLAHGTFAARGGGIVTITPPHGKAMTGRIPFDIRNGKLIELAHAPKPQTTGGYEKLARVHPEVIEAARTSTAPLRVSFKTEQALPRGQEYEVGLASLSAGSNCDDTTALRVSQPGKGKVVTVTLTPPSTATVPNTWCAGPAYVGVLAIPVGAPADEYGAIVGYASTSLP